MDDKTNLTTFLDLMEIAIKNSTPIKFQLFESLPDPDKILIIQDDDFKTIVDDKIIPDPLKTKIDSINEKIYLRYKVLTIVIIKYYLYTINDNNYLQKNNEFQKKIKTFIRNNEDVISYYAYLNTLFETIGDYPNLIVFLKRIFNDYVYNLYDSFPKSSNNTSKSPRRSSRFTYKKRLRKFKH